MSIALNGRESDALSVVLEHAHDALPPGAARRVLSYWNVCRGGRDMPERSDLDPRDIPSLLPHIFMVDVLPGPSRYRYRLIGTMIATWSGEDATGRDLDDPRCGDGVNTFVAMHDEVVRRGTPVMTIGQPALFEGSRLFFDRVLLPLAGDDGAVSMILGAADASGTGASDG